MEKKAALVGLMCLMFSIFGCVTSISNKTILGLDFELWDYNTNKPAVKIIPDHVYRFTAVVRTDKETIDNPDHREFILTSSNQTFSPYRFEDNYIHVRSTSNTFQFTGGDQFSLTVAVMGNQFAPITRQWPIDWDNFNTLDFRGRPGNPGDLNGIPQCNSQEFDITQKDMSTIDLRDYNGRSGKRGEDGTAGGPGQDVVLDVAYYDPGNAVAGVTGPMILVYERNTAVAALFKNQKITIKADGGDGGQGGKGFDGCSGSIVKIIDPKTKGVTSVSTIGGDGGDGGYGGDGGDGGRIKIVFLDSSDCVKSVLYSMKGGEGGSAGLAGRGGYGQNGGLIGRDGLLGAIGRRGHSGSLELTPQKTFDSMFVGINAPFFDRQKLLATP